MDKATEDKPSEDKGYEIEVNGFKTTISHQKLVAHDILELAEKLGAIPGKPEEYILQGDKGEYKWDDWVDLEEDNVFITIPNSPTQIAFAE